MEAVHEGWRQTKNRRGTGNLTGDERGGGQEIEQEEEDVVYWREGDGALRQEGYLGQTVGRVVG